MGSAASLSQSGLVGILRVQLTPDCTRRQENRHGIVAKSCSSGSCRRPRPSSWKSSRLAHATVIWDNANYQGPAYGADYTRDVGSMNDRASSVQNFGYCVTFFEDVSYGGRQFRICNDANLLTGYDTNLHLGETWNDRISSYHR